MTEQSVIAVTLGDVAGIGPEVVVRACCDARLPKSCRPIVVGHPEVVRRAIALVGCDLKVVEVDSLSAGKQITENELACWNPAGDDAALVQPGKLNVAAGQAAFEYLIAATHAALNGEVDAVTTAPLNKAALQLAGHNYPGHTEILAEA